MTETQDDYASLLEEDAMWNEIAGNVTTYELRALARHTVTTPERLVPLMAAWRDSQEQQTPEAMQAFLTQLDASLKETEVTEGMMLVASKRFWVPRMRKLLPRDDADLLELHVKLADSMALTGTDSPAWTSLLTRVMSYYKTLTLEQLDDPHYTAFEMETLLHMGASPNHPVAVAEAFMLGLLGE
jgi:hypothetical protein